MTRQRNMGFTQQKFNIVTAEDVTIVDALLKPQNTILTTESKYSHIDSQ